jgi:hypothetical protein
LVIGVGAKHSGRKFSSFLSIYLPECFARTGHWSLVNCHWSIVIGHWRVRPVIYHFLGIIFNHHPIDDLIIFPINNTLELVTQISSFSQAR